MKKVLLLVGLILIPVTSFASIDISLKYGMSGQPVMELQDLLVSEGCLSVSPTGYFGLLTLQGVKCFQSKYGIESTGYFGVLSRTKANTLVSDAIAGSDEAENNETGAVSSLASCKSGDLFDIKTGKPCTQTTEEIKKITDKIDALSTKVDAIKTNTDPVVGSAEEEVVQRGRLQIIGSDNAFQISLENYGPESSTLEVISYPSNLKFAPGIDYCSQVKNTSKPFPCKTFFSYIPVEVPEIRDGAYDLPDDDTSYSFTVKAFDKEYTATLKKNGLKVLFDNR